MVNVKKSQRKQVKTNRKFFLTLNILFILIFNVFPLVHITQTPTQSSHLTIDSIKTITEEVQSNNYVEATTSTTSWWNTSWHYRRVYNITGLGNISLPMNFTSLLRSLQVVNKTFDNSTITIVRYYSNGTVVVVNKTWFNESTAFHNRTNAVGTLSWRVWGTASYGVYFDVKENRGTRNPMNETYNLTPSGSIHTKLVSTEGWRPGFIKEDFPQTYYVNNTMLQVEVYTTALAKNLTAHFFYKGIAVSNTSLSTIDDLTWNATKKLNKIGDWTIHIIGYDDAGFRTTLNASFYCGRPDIIATDLIVPFCYVGYGAIFVAHMRAVNTTVKNVIIALRVNNSNVDINETITIHKNENITYNFTWKPTSKGEYNVSFKISYPDSNQSNNIIWKDVTVEGVPDLAVSKITVNPTPVNEGNPVAVTAHINNTGDGNAWNYTIVLYCEQNVNNHTMYYSQIKNSTNFSLKVNTSANVTLTWQKTLYGKANFNGEWAVGIKILNTNQTPDKHEANNNKSLYHVLKVIAAERNPPLLSNLECLLSIERGNQLLIRVTATDASGIDTVVISIKKPDKTYVNATMTADANDRYTYLFDTVQLGRHDFTIKATDLSPNKNQSIITGYFVVTEDQTPPIITYFGVNPPTQLPNRPVEIRCIASDYSGIRSAEVTIRFPDNQVETHVMSTPPADTKYVYTKTYESTGKYVFSIIVKDTFGNQKTTEEKTFWITDDLDDTDNDGMPDDWEERYGLNPYDPNDASQDKDNDGITNLEEYQQGTNPLKKLSSSSEISDRLQENWAYLTASLIVLILIILLALYGIRRRAR
jgi:putative lipoic acid-binding regulatory protein